MNLLKRFFPTSATNVGAVLYPRVEIKTTGPAVLVEQVQREDFVFEELATTLATYDSAGRTLKVVFSPTREVSVLEEGSTRTQRNTRPEWKTAEMRLESNGDVLFRYELPELNVRANYRTVVRLDQYKALLDMMRPATAKTAKSGLPAWAVTLMVLTGIFLVLVVFGGVRIQQGPGMQPVAQAPKPAAVKLSEGDQLNETEKLALAQVVSQSGIELSSGGKPFVIFSDPNCPACRELEGKLATLDKSLSPVIVPVSFKPNSKEAVAGVLCSKDVPGAWRAAASGGEPAATCAKGEAQAVANNAVFAALKFDRTPTFVTSNGKVAVGVKDYDGFVRWVKENSGG
ncbi:thioredoxin fold domain-containing protein [Polaromonas sp.]|uniref:thioredoxin fold domain-containing protein n=1 Tax=Polaromonas sp. TaxID=1869339 RepID=UPI00352B7085